MFSKRMIEKGAAHTAWAEKDFIESQRSHRLPIKTHLQFFELVSALIQDINHDFLNEGATSRPLPLASTKENQVQDWLFEQLKLRSDGPLSRVLEAQVRGKKRPDLIVASTSLDSQIAIEVKHGDKGWTLPDLKDAITKQLVGRYLKPAHRRSGVLFVTRHEKSSWRNPKTGKLIGFDEVLGELREHAVITAKEHSVSIRVDVIGIDLKSPPKT